MPNGYNRTNGEIKNNFVAYGEHNSVNQNVPEENFTYEAKRLKSQLPPMPYSSRKIEKAENPQVSTIRSLKSFARSSFLIRKEKAGSTNKLYVREAES